jgi:hypothetical protein
MNRIAFVLSTVFLVVTSRNVLPLWGAEPAPLEFPPGKAVSLFDGKSLGGWKVTPFGGEGEVRVEDGRLLLDIGSDMTGITWSKTVPTMDYELSLEAMRTAGGDFFCGLTFPVGEKPCSFIVGGWGGGTVGLSSIDDADASENETTTFHSFDDNRWYKIRVRVTRPKIEAWLDKEKVVDLKTADRRISIRSEVELSRPLGVSTWNTAAALRNIEVRRLTADELPRE